ncbi:Ger(x)C family spore germination protein [Bacillus pretiosus]|uniref:Ger(x)C family spore germination protein n=1 Tax=Bacillus pretiosus TaxID=2983392 RepID=UPI003D65F8C6
MIRKLILSVICCIYLVSCSQRVPLEKVSLILLISLDKTADGKIKIGTSIPLFHHEKQHSTVEHFVQASTIYDGFSKIDTKLTGYLTSSKAQIILIGKQFTQKKDWIQELDSSYRDPYANINARVVLVDDSAENILKVNKSDISSLPSYINKVVQSSIEDNQSVSSTIEQLMREKHEQGMTLVIPMIKRTKNGIDNVGIAFLNQQGTYKTKVTKEDVKLFNLIYKPKSTGRMVLHLTLPPKNPSQKINTSILVQNAKRKINVDFQKGKFIFNLDVNMNIALIEKTNENPLKNSLHGKKNISKLEQEIKQELNKKLQKMVHDMQESQIDPIGFSLYAKAFQYEEWKQVKKEWLHALSKAKIQVNTHIKIKDTGTIRS